MKNICFDANAKKAVATQKKFLCWFFILLTIFSCMLFSACGDKYKDLRISISTNGEVVEELNFIIDPSQESSAQRIGIEFAGIDKEDVGQVKVYSEPYELIVDSNYVYSGNTCYVDILPVMPSSGVAKLVVSHLASKQTKEIDLTIMKKSNDVQIVNSKYLIAIPSEGSTTHTVDFSQLVRLMPDSMMPGVGTDEVYFKIKNALPAGVETINANVEELQGVFSGFSLNSDIAESTDSTCVQIYPVTYMDGVAEVEDKYQNKVISVYFKKTLNDDNVSIVPTDDVEVDLNNLQLIANDPVLNTFKLSLKHEDKPLIETDFFDMYKVEVSSADEQKILTHVDSNNDILIIANVHTEELIEIEVTLKPIKYVGDLHSVKKSVFVKAELKADDIQVKKNGEIISTDNKINIFDYYEEGNSLGALFTFKPFANSGVLVHDGLNKMQIVVSPDILSMDNCSVVPDGVYVNSKLYSLSIHIYNELLLFTYDENREMMISQLFEQDDRIYIKYIQGDGVEESANFGLIVETIMGYPNEPDRELPENWKSLKPTDIDMDFNRLEGVKSMSIAAGQYAYDDQLQKGIYTQQGNANPEVIYLNRLKGLDDATTSSIYYLQVVDQSVVGIDGSKIKNAEFKVEIIPNFEAKNPVTLYGGGADTLKAGGTNADNGENGSDKINYSYETGKEKVSSFVFRKNTDIGEYIITFYQEGIKKASVKCVIYEDLSVVNFEDVEIDQNKKAFKNTKYADVYGEANYIVASGKDLNALVNLPQSVINSQIVKGYSFTFVVGCTESDNLTTIGEEEYSTYFEITHDDFVFNTAKLSFKNGTFIDEKPQYVYLTITIFTKQFKNIVEEDVTNSNEDKITIKFFIYDEITDQDISINHTSMTRYYEEYLGVYHKDKSNADLEINMKNSLWNYVTGNDGVNVRWVIDNKEEADLANQTKISLTFNSVTGNREYSRVVKVYVEQFENIFELQCVFNVEKPVLSERVSIKSELNLYETGDLYYINLKNGETYTVVAQNYSSKGQVTHPETIIQVFDENGSAYSAKDYFDVDQANGKITVKKVDNLHQFKLVVFAKDALQYIPSFDKSGYNDPSSFLMKFAGSEKGMCDNAYFVMDILLSDGTEENPYLIKTAKDFWEIDDTEAFKSAYYKLMANISLDNTSTKGKIQDFAGSIVTDADNIFSIDGITLDEDNINLFVNFSGTISNIKFVVKYDYELSKTATNLGLFDINRGTLTDVGVTVSGNAVFNLSSSTYNFGALVGENAGNIAYTKSTGVGGSIYLVGSSKVYFGGLVGKNYGKIIGCEENVDAGKDEVVLNTSNGRENALSQIAITSTLNHSSASVGGVVGLNTYYGVDDNKQIGIIHNAFVQATIYAESTSNVGGVIGSNNQEKVALKLWSDNDYISRVDNVLTNDWQNRSIYNVKSATIIKAKDNVGGIVGYDTNGVYIECDYQVLSSANKIAAIEANNNVGGIAGYSQYGKFAYCSVMSYCWNYAGLKNNLATVITNVADIKASDYVGGIVGYAHSSTETVTVETSGSEILERVVVIYSSVNAYLQATKEENGGQVGNIGGILSAGKTSTNLYRSIIFNAYFIGSLEGKVNYVTQATGVGSNNEKIHYLSLDNNGSSTYNTVYSLNIEKLANNVVAKLGHVNSGLEFIITNSTIADGGWDPTIDFWWGNVNINGGYLFITTDTEGENRLPIFDMAPEAIDVTINKDYAEEEGYPDQGLERVLLLKYFDFSQNSNLSDEQLNFLNNQNNKNKILKDLLSFKISPSGLGTVVLNVKSTNTNVVDITFDGKLLINGVGECELVFSSILNPNAGDVEARTIKVVVGYPIGDEFLVSTSKTDTSKIVNGKTLGIAKDTSKQMYVITRGSIAYDFNQDGDKEYYQFKTKDNFNLKIALSSASVNVQEYISISGRTGELIKLDTKTPFMISVLKKLENETFGVNITPYQLIEEIEIEYEKQAMFTLATKEGASNITFSYDDAIVYPNDTVYVSANIVTDERFTDETIDQIYNHIKIVGNNRYVYIKGLNNNRYNIYKVVDGEVENTIGSFVICVDDYSKYENNVQTIRFRIEFDDITLNEEAILQIHAIVTVDGEESVDDVVTYTIIPQRINKIEIKNYHKEQNEWVLNNILKPNNAGKLIIDIAPNNGYYSYLEISDITGDEEILFIQVDENENALSLSYDPSGDKKGIKLYHYEGQEKSRIYVLTQIDKNYSSKMHTIEIRAYSNNGTLLKRQTKDIDVKMLPEIVVEYMLPDGYSVGGTVKASEGAMGDFYLANGVDANFRIETKNSSGDLEYTISAYDSDGKTENSDLINKYEFVNIVGNHYALKRKDDVKVDDADLGRKIKIDFKTYAYFDNGDFDVAECSIEFTIVKFVIHGVSVNNSIDNSDTREIYGYTGKPVKLDFYFDEDDISFYDENSEGELFWDTVYEYSPKLETEYTVGSALYEIYSILKELNAYNDDYTIRSSNDYLVLNNGQFSNAENKEHEYVEIISTEIDLKSNSLTVEEGYDKTTKEDNGTEIEIEDPKYLAVEFRLNGKTAENTWEIDTFKATSDADQTYTVVKNYNLNFKNATSWYEPTVVHNEEDFLEMTSGGRYILAKDLVLKDYVPIDANLVEFDGNGRTITIQSFGLFNDEEIQAGLFRKIYENMIVKNVVLKYESIEDDGNMTFGKVNDVEKPFTDLCNNPNVNYTSLNFGGLAAVNNGIITNCSVEGVISVNASTIEQKKFASGENYAINFFVGGMVAENGATGYITNSTTELSIFAQANIGGFVHTNKGKIASCGVEKNSTIYAYNTGLDKTIVVKVAGFAVENSNHISMSYVNLAGLPFSHDYYQDPSDPNTKVSTVEIENGGTMSAKDISAGFVYSNSGNILDSYVDIAKTGVNNNTFSGFVYSNVGSISRAYTYINGGTKVDNNDTMFAPAGTTNLVQCIEFVVLKAGYSNGVEQGLTSLEIGKRYNKEYYQEQGFAFGDNESAVWKIDPNELPKLVSTQEKVLFNGTGDYTGLLPLIRNEEIDEETGEQRISYKPNFAYYGTKENPFIISDLETWNEYFTNETTAYYRVVRDLNFASLGNNPETSKMTFKGNIQGNNMKLENIMLYSTSTLNALGLFRDMSGVSDKNVQNSVRNLTLTTTSVWASRTSAVGLLAGLVEDFNLYNITIDAQGVIMVGGNAVGGLAGVVRGDFDIDQISSNIGANSTRASTQYNYAIYMSKNNKEDISSNLASVYYAGSVVGILDGYTVSNYNINDNRDLNDKYFMVRNVSVNGSVSIIGDSVGGAFGLVGERVYVNNVNVNISGMLAGVQYSAGVAGENRGIIDNGNWKVVIADKVFEQSTNVSAGVVGLNLGGLVRNIQVEANIYKTGFGKIVGGVIGRNIYGTVNSVVVDGEFNAYFTGGVVGASYTNSMLINATTGAGTISADCKTNNTLLIPKHVVQYFDNGVEIKNYGNVALTNSTMKYLITASKEFYSYKNNEEGENTLATTTVKYKVLGLIVGLGYEDSAVEKIKLEAGEEAYADYANRYAITVTDSHIVFNVDYRNSTGGLLSQAEMQTLFGKISFVAEETEVLLKDDAVDANDVACKLDDYNLLTIAEGKAYVMYLIGSKVSSFDSWYNTYSDEFMIVKMASGTEQA